MSLVFVPSAESELDLLAAGVTLGPRAAYRATPALMEAFGFGPDQAEDAEHAAMLLASVAGLIHHQERVVVAADLRESAIRPGAEAHNGQVEIDGCPAEAVRSFFTDAEGLDVAPQAEAVQGLDLDSAWESDAVRGLLAEADLAWHDSSELSL